MSLRAASLLAVAALVAVGAVALAGCGAGATEETTAPSASGAPADGAGGTRLAPGLYDLADGTARAVGSVEYRDLEGGFWAIVGRAEAEGNVGAVVAVIANGDAFASQLRALEGLPAIVTGRRLEGVSARMSGPEIEATSVEAAPDSVGPAE
jgi:hypothetical protein